MKDGGNIIETRPMKQARHLAAEVMKAIDSGRPIGQIVGPPGSGKTTIGRDLATRHNAVRVCVFPGVSGKQLVGLLGEAVGMPKDPGSTATQITRLIPYLRGRLLIVDEANHLRWQQLEQLRFLADEGEMGLILIGTELLDRPFRDAKTGEYLAQLASRIGAKRLRTDRFTKVGDVESYLIRPRFGDVPKPLSQRIMEACKGFWRDFEELADTCERLMRTNDIAALDERIIDVAASLMAPGRR